MRNLTNHNCMPILNETIKHFIQGQKIVTICCTDEQNDPFCFSCFYTFHGKDCLLYFKSSASSMHCRLMAQKPRVSGTILPDKLNIFSVAGIQFSGTLLDASHELIQDASRLYHIKFPFAMAIPGEVFAIYLETITMTVMKNGFARKLCFQRNEDTI